jgi:hypothetical protein
LDAVDFKSAVFCLDFACRTQTIPDSARSARLTTPRLQPDVVVAMHQHRNDEVFSYLRKGTMLHQDTSVHGFHSHQLTLPWRWQRDVA